MKKIMNEITTRIRDLFDQRGDSEYGGEVVTQLEHGLQFAALAEQAGSDAALIAAALVHDIGHLLHDLPDDAPDQGVDDVHEAKGCAFLKKYFPASVYEPVRMHVAAKRYLCTVDASYYDQLSPPSITSLELQGGTMSDDELEKFRSSPHWEAALDLRKWDDTAKVEGLETPNLEHFLGYVDQVVLTAEPS
ncbi:MAG: phosphonate degradation HD-domain oxygenase [Planctomycetota bacterium]